MGPYSEMVKTGYIRIPDKVTILRQRGRGFDLRQIQELEKDA